MRQPRSPAVVALTLLFLADPRTAGAALADPTRPALGGVRDESPRPASDGAARPAVAASAAEPAAPPALQSLHLPREGEPTAIVDGQILKVGGKVGQFEVTQIDPLGLMVKGPGGRQRWTLSGVEVLDSRQATPVLKVGLLGKTGKSRAAPAVDPGLITITPTPVAPGNGPSNSTPPPAVPKSTGRGAVALAQAWEPPVAAVAPTSRNTWAVAPAARAVKRNARPTWTVDPQVASLRYDVADLQRQVKIMAVVSATPVTAASVASSQWQRPLSPKPLPQPVQAVWAPIQDQARAQGPQTAAQQVAGWRPPARDVAPRNNWASRRSSASVHTANVGPMPASVVWRTPAAPWQPSSDALTQASTPWLTASAVPVQFAALEPRIATPRQFAKATARVASRWHTGSRWANASQPWRPVAVVHSYPQPLPAWQAPSVASQTSDPTSQVALALETP